MAVFSSVRLGVSPEVNALATLFLGVVFALVSNRLLAEGARRTTAATFRPVEKRPIYFAAAGSSSAYISGSTVWRQVSRRGKIFSIARAE
jgi:hypothetical protein